MMESTKIETKEQLDQIISSFIESSETTEVYTLNQSLRRDLRPYLNKYPGRYYHLALSCLPDAYKFTVSKTPIELKWEELTPKTRSTLEKMTGMKSLDESYDEWTNVKMWKKLAIDSILALGCEKDWQNKHFDYEAQIQKKLLQSPNYPKWKELSLSDRYKQEVKKFKQTLYIPKHHGLHFVSIDLKEANYQVLRHYGLATENRWEEFFTKFTQDPRVLAYFSKLKLMRLKSLVKLDAEKQKIAWQGLTVDIFNKMKELGLVDDNALATWNSDELVFYDENHSLQGPICEFMKSHFSEWNVKIEEFDLKIVQENEPFYVKKFADGSFVLKCVAFKQLPTAVNLLNKNKEFL